MEETLQQTADRLKHFPGNVKGEVFRVHAEYIKHKEGEEGVKKIEEKMAELGAPIKFDEIKPFEWISEGMSSLTIIVAKEIFSWTEEDVFEMGRFAPRFSFIIKILIQYITGAETIIKNIPKYWNKHYDFGSMEVVDFKKEEKKVILRERGVDTHPLICIYHAGYFKGLGDLAVKSSNISIKETACVHKDNDYNEFVIEWE